MKPLMAAFLMLFLFAPPTFALDATTSASPSPRPGQVEGLYDYEDTASDAASASVSATPTPRPRTVTYSTAETPVSGAVENTIALLLSGFTLLILGFKFSKSA